MHDQSASRLEHRGSSAGPFGVALSVLFLLVPHAPGPAAAAPAGVHDAACGCGYALPAADTVIVVDDVGELQGAINAATRRTTILVRAGHYDLRTAPYAGSGIGIQVGNHDVTIRSETGNRDDVVFDAGGMAAGVAKAFMISDYTTGRDSLRNITLADITIRNASAHLISVQGEFHPRNLTIHNVHLVNAGEQLVKVNPETLSDPTPVSNGTIACCVIEYETHLDEGWYTQGIDIHTGDHWVIRNNLIRNVRSHPDSGVAGAYAILVWTNSVGTLVERNVILDCDRGIAFGNWGHDGMPYLDHTGGVIRNNIVKGYAYANPEGTMGSYESLSLVNAVYAVVSNNTLYAPGDIHRGIDLVGSAVRFNTIVNNITDQEIVLRAGAVGAANAFECNIENAGASNYVDAVGGDFHLAPGSPAVDSGAWHDELCADVDCEMPADGAPDVGADEAEGAPYGGAPCGTGYAGGPMDPGDLGSLFPPPRPQPPYVLCGCDPLPPAGALADTVSDLEDLQALLHDLHVAGDERERTIFLADGEYFLGDSPFGTVHAYTSHLTLRSLSGDRDAVVLYGGQEQEYGIVLDSYGTREIQGITIADLTIRDVARNAVLAVAYYDRVDDLLLHNVRLVNAGEDFVRVQGSAAQGSSGAIECCLVERDSLAKSGWASNGVDVQHGTGWTIRDCVFRDLRPGVPPDAPTSGHAVRVWDASSGTRIERNVFDRCGEAVLLGDPSAGHGHTGGIVLRNVFIGHGGSNPDGSTGSGTSITLSNSPGAVVLHNSIHAPSAPSVPSIKVDQAGSTGLLVQNNVMDGSVGFSNGAPPEASIAVTNREGATAADFADASAGDLHLAATSPAVNGGTAHAGDGPDVDCVPVADGLPDIGADEFAPTADMADPQGGAPGLEFSGNHPNPFGPGTEITFTLAAADEVAVEIHDVLGRRVRVIVAGAVMAAGAHGVAWDGRDAGGREMPNGVYWCRIRTATQGAAGKMLLVRR